jgi:CheY-like chemotaxis protein
VDDDGAILRLLQRALGAYDLITASGGPEALALLDHCQPDLIITDYLMSDLTGPELIARARQRHPGVKAIVLTAHASLVDQESWWPTERHLAKPCRMQELRAAVAELIGEPSSPLRVRDHERALRRLGHQVT